MKGLFWIGPYAKWTVAVEKVKEDNCRDKTNCPNSTTRFCSLCGLETIRRFQETKKESPEVRPHDVLHNDDLLYVHRCQDKNGKSSWLAHAVSCSFSFFPNSTECSYGQLVDAGDETTPIDLSSGNMTADIMIFCADYQESIDALTKAFGKAPTFHWGIITMDD